MNLSRETIGCYRTTRREDVTHRIEIETLNLHPAAYIKFFKTTDNENTAIGSDRQATWGAVSRSCGTACSSVTPVVCQP